MSFQLDFFKECIHSHRISDWNTWYQNEYPIQYKRGDKKKEPFTIEDITISDVDLTGFCLYNARFNKVRFSNVIFGESNLYRSKFSNTLIENSEFEKTNLEDTEFKNTKIKNCSFSHTKLSHSSFEESEYLNCSVSFSKFDHTTLYDTNIINSKIHYSDFKSAGIFCVTLDGVDGNSEVIEGDFKQATILKSSFKNTLMKMAGFENIMFFEDSSFQNVRFEESSFKGSELQNVDFLNSNMRGVDLQSTVLTESHLSGTDFSYAKVDGITYFRYPTLSDTKEWVDENTYFTGVGLSSIRMPPTLRTTLEKNVRKLHWKEWYSQHKILRYFVQIFWVISDYGSSTWRIISSFILLNLLFTIIYGVLSIFGISTIISITPTISGIITAFFQTILLMFGILEFRISDLGVVSLSISLLHVVFGYIILAALVTRFAILFESSSP
ncbi:pentapeptide repeat-containing protein [Methanocorpusculum sp.]|nr:pentapeptide repeat-containing protein [Methanocorpusculum sp.]